MKQDIRKLFDHEKNDKIHLPKNHKEQFLEKLETIHTSKNKRNFKNLYKIVASILIIISCTIYYKINYPKIKKTSFEIQIDDLEKEYLKDINKEWKGLKTITNDTLLLKKLSIKMKDYEENYQKIIVNFKDNPNNINVLESLITNLQRRLQLINEIKEHINELNQKSTSNETIYI
ncbi:hypothetical protein [Polaribacter sp.]|uniref:hypothetical protein n=1 Tax=Polaribacter sp. TaxID=1920175 RepID=UPI004047599F